MANQELTVEQQILLHEYDKLQEMAIHYDTFNMRFTEFVALAITILWGLIFRSDILSKPEIVVPLEIFTFTILSLWLQFITIHREIVVLKFNRAHAIEEKLGMQQHRIFRHPRRYHKPGGHTVEMLMYGVLSSIGFFAAFHSLGFTVNPLQWPCNIAQKWSDMSCIGWWLYLTASFTPVLPLQRLWIRYLIPPESREILKGRCFPFPLWHVLRCKATIASITPNYTVPPIWAWIRRVGYPFPPRTPTNGNN